MIGKDLVVTVVNEAIVTEKEVIAKNEESEKKPTVKTEVIESENEAIVRIGRGVTVKTEEIVKGVVITTSVAVKIKMMSAVIEITIVMNIIIGTRMGNYLMTMITSVLLVTSKWKILKWKKMDTIINP